MVAEGRLWFHWTSNQSTIKYILHYYKKNVSIYKCGQPCHRCPWTILTIDSVGRHEVFQSMHLIQCPWELRKQFLCARAACFWSTVRRYSFRTLPRQLRKKLPQQKDGTGNLSEVLGKCVRVCRWFLPHLQVPACPFIILQIEVLDCCRANRLSSISLSGFLSFSLMFGFSW
jgi:hypothetical protein